MSMRSPQASSTKRGMRSRRVSVRPDTSVAWDDDEVDPGTNLEALPHVDDADIREVMRDFVPRRIFPRWARKWAGTAGRPTMWQPKEGAATQGTNIEFCINHDLNVARNGDLTTLPTLTDMTEATLMARTALRQGLRLSVVIRRFATRLRILRTALHRYSERRRRRIEHTLSLWDAADASRRERVREKFRKQISGVKALRHQSVLESLRSRGIRILTAEELNILNPTAVPVARRRAVVHHFLRAAYADYHQRCNEWRSSHDLLVRRTRHYCITRLRTVLCMPEMLKRFGAEPFPEFAYSVSAGDLQRQFEVSEAERECLERTTRAGAYESEVKRQLERLGLHGGDVPLPPTPPPIPDDKKHAAFGDSLIMMNPAKMGGSVFEERAAVRSSTLDWMKDCKRKPAPPRNGPGLGSAPPSPEAPAQIHSPSPAHDSGDVLAGMFRTENVQQRPRQSAASDAHQRRRMSMSPTREDAEGTTVYPPHVVARLPSRAMLEQRHSLSPRLRAKQEAQDGAREARRAEGISRFQVLGDGKAKPTEVREVLDSLHHFEAEQAAQEAERIASARRPRPTLGTPVLDLSYALGAHPPQEHQLITPRPSTHRHHSSSRRRQWSPLRPSAVSETSTLATAGGLLGHTAEHRHSPTADRQVSRPSSMAGRQCAPVQCPQPPKPKSSRHRTKTHKPAVPLPGNVFRRAATARTI